MSSTSQVQNVTTLSYNKHLLYNIAKLKHTVFDKFTVYCSLWTYNHEIRTFH